MYRADLYVRWQKSTPCMPWTADIFSTSTHTVRAGRLSRSLPLSLVLSISLSIHQSISVSLSHTNTNTHTRKYEHPHTVPFDLCQDLTLERRFKLEKDIHTRNTFKITLTKPEQSRHYEGYLKSLVLDSRQNIRPEPRVV